MAVTGAIQFDVSGIANTDPYTIPVAVTTYGGNFKVKSGYLNRSGEGNVGFYTDAAQVDDVVKSRVEVGVAGSVKYGPAVVNTSNNGWYASIGSGFVRTFRVDAGVRQASGDAIGSVSLTLVTGSVVELNYTESTGLLEVFVDGSLVDSGTDTTYQGVGVRPGYHVDMSGFNDAGAASWAGGEAGGPDYTQRKGSTFDVTHTLGTITTAALNGTTITINTTGAGTVNLTDTSGITTSGTYDLALGDGTGTEKSTVQLNVYGVVPSNNPAQKDGAALASLTDVQIRITDGANLDGPQVYYSGTETTDASGNFATLDVSTSAAAAADPVLMTVLTSAGNSITSTETVELI
jgi:hypothetical protein